MNLKTKFQGLVKIELIEIAELSDYTPEAKNIAYQILQENYKDDFLSDLNILTSHIKKILKLF